MNDTESGKVQALGPVQADPADPDARGGKLVRLGELITFLMDRDGPDSMPLTVAACATADVWRDAVVRVAVFQTQRAAYACRADDAPPQPKPITGGRAVGTRPVNAPTGWASNLLAPIPYGASDHKLMQLRHQATLAPAANKIASKSWPDELRKKMGSGPLTRAHLFNERDRLAYQAIPAATAADVFGFGPAAEVSAPVVRLVTAPDKAATDAAEAVAALRQKIKDHQPAQKTGSRWHDRPAMLRALLQQYNDRMALPGASSEVAEEQIAGLWKGKPNTVHTYLTEARKLQATAITPHATAASKVVQA